MKKEVRVVRCMSKKMCVSLHRSARAKEKHLRKKVKKKHAKSKVVTVLQVRSDTAGTYTERQAREEKLTVCRKSCR